VTIRLWTAALTAALVCITPAHATGVDAALSDAPKAVEEVDVSPAAVRLGVSPREAPKGTIALAALEHPAGFATVKAKIGSYPVGFVPARDGRWEALVGVDLDWKPGPMVLSVDGTLATGEKFLTSVIVDVVDRAYPEQRLNVDRKYQEFSTETLARIRAENKRLGKIWRTTSSDALWTAPFENPIDGKWGGGFGARRIFNGVPKRPHSGVDVAAVEGTPFAAANTGKVVMAEDLYFSGNTVIIDHGAGLYTMYFHLSEFAVAEGDQVERGQVIGKVGKTGRVTGPHLHWGVKLNRARVDPHVLVHVTGGPNPPPRDVNCRSRRRPTREECVARKSAKSEKKAEEELPLPGGKAPDEMKFEEALGTLEEIVEQLEAGEMSLEDSVKAFESGMRLVKACTRRLDEAERRVEVLVGDEVRAFDEDDAD